MLCCWNRVTADLVNPTCAQCGYDLAGLRVEERCPECGLRVWGSSSAYAGPRQAEAASALRWSWLALACTLFPFAVLITYVGWFLVLPACAGMVILAAGTSLVKARRVRGTAPFASLPESLRASVKVATGMSWAAVSILALLIVAIGIWW